MEYDSVPVLHKLKKKESSLRSKVAKETWRGRWEAPDYRDHANEESSSEEIKVTEHLLAHHHRARRNDEERFYNIGRLAGVEFAIDLIENGGEHE